MRGATRTHAVDHLHNRFQSTRPMRGATSGVFHSSSIRMFQSTRPMRGATRVCVAGNRRARVSIHAPHAGRDKAARRLFVYGHGFNPRAPCGARLLPESAPDGYTVFQSTRPMRGATTSPLTLCLISGFQSTRPMRGATTSPLTLCLISGFQSTRPMRGATPLLAEWQVHTVFQSTRPMRGATTV